MLGSILVDPNWTRMLRNQPSLHLSGAKDEKLQNCELEDEVQPFFSARFVRAHKRVELNLEIKRLEGSEGQQSQWVPPEILPIRAYKLQEIK